MPYANKGEQTIRGGPCTDNPLRAVLTMIVIVVAHLFPFHFILTTVSHPQRIYPHRPPWPDMGSPPATIGSEEMFFKSVRQSGKIAQRCHETLGQEVRRSKYFFQKFFAEGFAIHYAAGAAALAIVLVCDAW